MSKDMDFCRLQEIHSTSMGKTTTKTGLEATKTASKKVIHKTAEATGEFVQKKSLKKIMKPKPVTEEVLKK